MTEPSFVNLDWLYSVLSRSRVALVIKSAGSDEFPLRTGYPDFRTVKDKPV